MKKNMLCIIAIIFLGLFFLLLKNDVGDVTTKFVSYNGNNLQISIDGQVSNTFPTSGTYYLVDYDCNSTNTKVVWDNDTYTLNITNGTKKSAVACYLEFKSKPLLSEMPVGSYVKYTGTNGCSGKSCEGQNAYYEGDTSMGYCSDENFKFYVNGWRIGYIENGSAYLVTAGAPECMCTASDGTVSTSCSNSITFSGDIYKHTDNMDAIALKYCNSTYVKGGLCNSTTAWAMNASDFQKINGNVLSSSSCNEKYSDMSCGYTNDLIDNGGYYWLATPYSSSSYNVFYWNPFIRYVGSTNSSTAIGVRPVLNLKSSIIVTGGLGTYENPYTIGVGE